MALLLPSGSLVDASGAALLLPDGSVVDQTIAPAVLVIDDALHGHAADSPTLVLEYFLSVNDALHGHAADSLTLVRLFARRVEILTDPNLALVARLFALNSDVLVDTAIQVVATPNRGLMYRADFVGNYPAGIYLVVAYTDDTSELPIGAWYTALEDADGIYRSGNYADVVSAASDAALTVIRKILQNKQVTDPSSGVMTVYDDDDTTPLLTAQLYENVAQTQTYRGQGAEVRERLE